MTYDPIKFELGYAVVATLNGRKGFDDWWDGIDVDIQQEIIEELTIILHQVGDK